MTKSELFPLLEDIVFAAKNPEDIEREIIQIYENLAGRSLARGDPVRLLIEAFSFVIVLLRSKIDYAAKMNLLAYALGIFLDHIGALLEVRRLSATNAVTTLEFTLSAPQTGAVIIPGGIRATPGDGDILFATVEAVDIPAGETQATVTAECTQAGTQGNGYLPGQIKLLVDPFPYEMSVKNLTTTYGGADTESDENFRERIQLAPESLSVAGPKGAYKFHALSSLSSVVDVAVIGPEDAEWCSPGNVYLFPLLVGGALPNQEILDNVFEICNAEFMRPDTDYLHVKIPEVVEYNLQVSYWIDRARATQATQIQAAVKQAVADWILWQKSKLGRDINPSELNHRIVAAGAKRAEIISPAFTALKDWEIAIDNAVSVTLGGLESG